MPLPHIQIGEDLIDDALLASVDIVQELNHHWWCTVLCRNTEDKRIPAESFLGQTVQVKTTDEQGVEHVNFSGFILDVELTYEVWGSYTAQLKAVSDSYKADLAARKEYYAFQTLAAVSSKAAGHAGLSATTHAPASKALNYVQYGETDFSFINRIADDYGCWVRPTPGGVEIYNSFQSGATVTWREEDGLLDFKTKGTLSPASYNGSHYDHHVMESNTFDQVSTPPQFYPSAANLVSAVQSQSAALLPAAFAPQRARVMTLSDYQTSLQNESQRSIGANITASGHSRNQQLMAGNTVTVSGDLDAAGTYGLIKVTHHWLPSGYSNEFLCTPWKNYRNPEQPELRPWYGVVPARVVEHNDPKKMGRLKVQFFWQTDGSTHWARTTSPHAGPDRGFMFMPEVGDEVAVVFEDGDPERPVILGSLWNGVHQAPRAGFFAPEADIPDNNVKRIVTKSGNRMQMIDKPGNETVVLASPNRSSLTLTEKHDSTGRTLIHLHSEGDIILTAPNGRVHIKSKLFSREIGDGSAAGEPPGGGSAAPTSSAAEKGLLQNVADHPDEHGLLWRMAHGAGLITTQQDRVNTARNFFNNNDVTIDGKEIDPSKMTDQEVLDAFKRFNQDYRSQGGGLIGMAAITGPPGPKVDLPANPDDLLSRGYTETTHPDAAAAGHRSFENPETGDKLRFDKGEPGKPGFRGQDHYHRENPNFTGKQDRYLDSNGNPTGRGSDASHLPPTK